MRVEAKIHAKSAKGLQLQLDEYWMSRQVQNKNETVGVEVNGIRNAISKTKTILLQHVPVVRPKMVLTSIRLHPTWPKNKVQMALNSNPVGSCKNTRKWQTHYEIPIHGIQAEGKYSNQKVILVGS